MAHWLFIWRLVVVRLCLGLGACCGAEQRRRLPSEPARSRRKLSFYLLRVTLDWVALGDRSSFGFSIGHAHRHRQSG